MFTRQPCGVVQKVVDKAEAVRGNIARAPGWRLHAASQLRSTPAYERDTDHLPVVLPGGTLGFKQFVTASQRLVKAAVLIIEDESFARAGAYRGKRMDALVTTAYFKVQGQAVEATTQENCRRCLDSGCLVSSSCGLSVQIYPAVQFPISYRKTWKFTRDREVDEETSIRCAATLVCM